MRSSAEPGALDQSAEVAATVRLLHRRHGWAQLAFVGLIAFALTDGANANAQQEGTPSPSWFVAIVIALGVLTVVGIIALTVDSALVRRRPDEVRKQAATLAARHPSRRLHHYPPHHWVIWVLRLVGMVLILGVAVVSVPGVCDGVAYLAGAEKSATFDPVAYQTNCDQYTCQTSTNGVLTSGSTVVEAAWPDVVPLGKSFRVREPLWRWGLGAAMIDGDGTAIVAIVVGLLIESAGVLVVIYLVRLTSNWRRHRRQRRSEPSDALT
jgi:hypothetical protein